MNIYFSCSITGGRQDQAIYQTMVNAIRGDGHDVPTAQLSRPDVVLLESDIAPNEVYRRDVDWVRGCDALVAEVSTPSHGVGYEIALALLLEKPVLCCYQAGRRVSKMITGNDSPTLRVIVYESADEAVEIVRRFLNGIE
jgi:2'-deoxynucleoside 5'-phosphate N-hydrolase